MAWDNLVASGEGGIGSFELLAGCVEIWKVGKKDGIKTTREMNNLNMAMVARIAGQFLIRLSFACLL
jgi:hypothetical protein